MKLFIAVLRGPSAAVRVSLEAESLRDAQSRLDLWMAGWIASGHGRPPEITSISFASRPRDAIDLFSPEGWEAIR